MHLLCFFCFLSVYYYMCIYIIFHSRLMENLENTQNWKKVTCGSSTQNRLGLHVDASLFISSPEGFHLYFLNIYL